MTEERDPLALAMLAAWVNVTPDKLPKEMRAMADPHTMAAWKRVGEAAVAYVRAEQTSAQGDPRMTSTVGQEPTSESAPATYPGLHPETAAMVDRFAAALKEKLAAAEAKYGYADHWRTDDWEDEWRDQLLRHVDKGDPLDVAAYSAFGWARDWRTSADTSGRDGDDWTKLRLPEPAQSEQKL